MKANELMIGDWVMVYREGVADCGQYFEWQEAGRVIGLGDGVITVRYYDNEEETESEEDVKPIATTPEILEKNGFKMKELESNFKYVHELQHALRLCGIEKEIEL